MFDAVVFIVPSSVTSVLLMLGGAAWLAAGCYALRNERKKDKLLTDHHKEVKGMLANLKGGEN